LQILISIFLVSVGIQVVFLAEFLIAFSRKREKRNFSPPVSVVVCAHDEEFNLIELIPLLLSQDYNEFEVIIVNDRSNDETFDLLLNESKKNERLRVVQVTNLPEHVNGKKYALTLGIKAAKHDWILFTDADCRPDGNQWIKSMASEFADETTFVLGYSPYLIKPGFLNLFIRFESLITAIQYMGFALLNIPYMGVGRNMAYRKSFFLKNKGFNNLIHVTGGDDDLFVNQHAKAQNTAVVTGKESLAYSVPETTIKSFLRQKVRHLSVGKRYKFKHQILLSFFTLSWMLTWFTGIPLLFLLPPEFLFLFIIPALVVRLTFLAITMQVAVKRLGQKFPVWPVLFLDFLYSIYYISTGLIALLTKKVRWKN
jgi:cellulose synthase/poly-beta-1,6-N-acetylglucosamine synthase-like glycosyltransferase